MGKPLIIHFVVCVDVCAFSKITIVVVIIVNNIFDPW